MASDSWWGLFGLDTLQLSPPLSISRREVSGYYITARNGRSEHHRSFRFWFFQLPTPRKASIYSLACLDFRNVSKIEREHFTASTQVSIWLWQSISRAARVTLWSHRRAFTDRYVRWPAFTDSEDTPSSIIVVHFHAWPLSVCIIESQVPRGCPRHTWSANLDRPRSFPHVVCGIPSNGR